MREREGEREEGERDRGKRGRVREGRERERGRGSLAGQTLTRGEESLVKFPSSSRVYRILQNPCNVLQPRLPYMEVNYTH